MISEIDHIHIRQESIARHNRKRKIRKHKIQHPSPNLNHNTSASKPNQVRMITLSEDFRLLDNTECVIEDLNSILPYCKRPKQGYPYDVFIDMSKVKYFDLPALTCLLTLVRFCENKCYGNEPTDYQCKKYFEDSGFLNLVVDINGKEFKPTNTKNLIIEMGTDKTRNIFVGQEIRKSIKHLIGVPERFPPIYSIIQEICPNSIEHANTNIEKRNWMLGIKYENDKVCFTMVDKGQGIVTTLKKAMIKRIKKYKELFKDNQSILISAFNGDYQSKSNDDNRNKGLPCIKSQSDKRFVQSMVVITNDCLLNLSIPTKLSKLKIGYRGTIYYWEITKENYMTWKQQITSHSMY